jgi:hypothetical protein
MILFLVPTQIERRFWLKKIFVLMSCLLLICFSLKATNIRGRLLIRTGGYSRGLAIMKVELFVNNGGSFHLAAYAISDRNGYYFFMNYQFPFGTKYYVKVLGRYYPPTPLIIPNSGSDYLDIPSIYPISNN